MRYEKGHMSINIRRARACFLSAVLAIVAVAPIAAEDRNGQSRDWPMFGQNLSNTSSTEHTQISAKNISNLQLNWSVTTGGDVSARAAVVDGVAYFPDWGGNLWAIDAENGTVIWSHQISDYGVAPNTSVRTTPAVEDGKLYIGTQQGGWLMAINARTGELIWKTQLEPSDPYTILTTSPVVYHGVVYAGVASKQETLAALFPGYVCCTARGSVVAVKASTGTMLWKTYTVPAGYSGGGVWGSNPVIDAERNALFIGTGNNYSEPTDPSYLSCIAAGNTEPECISLQDHIDSILALDLSSGAVKWATRLMTWNQPGLTDGRDDWNISCFFAPFSNCLNFAIGPDYDFGSAPNEITFRTHKGKKKTIIGAGQKSGIYYALDPDTGDELWRTQVGPGSSFGGVQWGTASDGQRIYVAISDFFGVPYAAGNAGSWSALDPETGAILWQTPDPNGAVDLGPMTVANGVVYAPSMSSRTTNDPTMVALDATNGKVVWSFAAGASVIAGATIVRDSVYWGTGYAHSGVPGFTGNNQFYAFTLRCK